MFLPLITTVFSRCAGSMSSASRFQRADSGAYRGPFGHQGEDPDQDFAAVTTGESYPCAAFVPTWIKSTSDQPSMAPSATREGPWTFGQMPSQSLVRLKECMPKRMPNIQLCCSAIAEIRSCRNLNLTHPSNNTCFLGSC